MITSTGATGKKVFRSARAAESRSEVGIRLMAVLGFLRRDFDVFAIDDFSARLAKIDEFVTPRLTQLALDFNGQLSRNFKLDFFPHYPPHMRLTPNTPTETVTTFWPSPAAYN